MTPLDPVGPDWRSNRPNSGGSARRVFVPMLAVAGVAAGFLALLFWLQPARKPVLLIANTAATPFARADFDRLSELPAQAPPVSLTSEVDRDRLRVALAALRNVSSRTPVVVYLSGMTEVDATGNLVLAPASDRADHVRNRLPFVEVLQYLTECRASHKLLVLNLAGQTQDWVALAIRDLEANPDAKRLVLFSQGVGERSLSSLEWNGSVFAGYFAEGFHGAADGWNESGSRDGRVTTDELATYVRVRVSRWAEQNRTSSQTPWQMGTASAFEVSTVSQVEPVPSTAITYPAALRDAWAERDAWLTDGRSEKQPQEFAALEKALLTMDRQWASGATVEVARSVLKPTPGEVTPLARIPGVLQDDSPADAAQITAVTRYLARASAPPDPTEKPPVAILSALLTVATADVEWTTAKWTRLNTLLATVEPEAGSFLSLVVRRISSSADETITPELAGRMVRVTARFEAVARDPEFFPWARTALSDCAAKLRTAQAFVFSPRHVSTKDAEAALTLVEDHVRTLAFVRSRFAAAVKELRLSSRIPRDATLTASCQKLQEALTKPDGALLTAANLWSNLTTETAAARTTALEAIRPEAIARLRERAASGTDGPATLDAFDRILASPLLSATDRAAIWGDRLALSARLHDNTRSRDLAENEAIRLRTATAAWIDPTERPPSVAFQPSDSKSFQDRLRSPSNQDFLNWHAGRFEDWTTNPLDFPQFSRDAEFAAKALEACRTLGAAPPTRPQMEWTVKAEPVILTLSQSTQKAGFLVRLLGSDQPLSAKLAVHSPTTEWVQASVSSDIKLSPIQAIPTTTTVTVGSAPQKWSRFSGVLLSAKVQGQPSFKRLGVNTDQLSNRLELLVKSGAEGPELPATTLAIRPNGKPVTFEFSLSNPTTVPQTVIARLADPLRETAAITIPPGKSVPLVFPAPAPVPPPANPMTPVSAAPPVAVPDELRIQLLDPKTFTEMQVFAVRVKVLEPSESVQIREVVYRPGSDGKPGELSAILAERESFRGGPMPVAMSFPVDRNPGLVIPDGKLSGTLESGGTPVRLYASNPILDRARGSTVTLTFTIDGVERVAVYRGDLGSDAGIVRLQPVPTPRVKIVCEEFATGTEPLPIRFETENAPPTSTLEIEIGTESGTEFRRDYKLDQNPRARRKTTAMTFEAKGGLTLLATETDPEVRLPVDRLVGVRWIRTRLLETGGREIARTSRRVVFDGSAPRDVRFLDPPARAKADSKLAVRIAVDPPVSGIKDVEVFLGKPVKNAAPANAALIPARRDGEAWTATIPLGPGPVPADISARVVSGSGLAGFATITVELVPAAEFDKPKPGSITGVVVEGTIPQPGLVVQLFDDKGKEKAKATTKENGSFKFVELPPGKYRVFSEKVTTGREKSEPVEVKAGQDATVVVSLILK